MHQSKNENYYNSAIFYFINIKKQKVKLFLFHKKKKN